MVDIQECPICKQKVLQEFRRCEDHTVSHETFDIRLCTNCTLAITTPRPDSNKLGSYYQSEEYISHSGKSSGGIGFLYKSARSFALNWKRSLIHQHKSGFNILDFGCGTGEFLETMKKSGWQISGVEPSDSARLKAETLLAQGVPASLDEIPENKFDVITAWHVIEHVPDLLSTILKLKGLLKKDGIVFIAVPNYESPDANYYKEYWAGYDVPRHLWHFSKKSMNMMLSTTGFELIDTIPMKLDAYYVSMLSEKYRNNSGSILGRLAKGFLSGINSNGSARKKTNHSSLIYIAKIHEA